MLVSVLYSWCRKAVRGIFRSGAIRAYAVGFALCLLLSGCLFGSGNKQDTAMLQPMADEAPNPAKKTIRYSVKLQSKPQNGDLVSELRENSQLVWLHDDLPDSRVGLERRALEDVETARKILHSQGYYDGTVRYRIDWEAQPPEASITLRPGERYVMGPTKLRYERTGPEGEPVDKDLPQSVRGVDFMENAPDTLEAFGLAEGSPAEAQAVLNAVASVVTAMRKAGYPLAEQGKARYIIDRSTHTLEADVLIKTGPLLRMGPVVIKEENVRPADNPDAPGAPAVNEDYLNKLSPWIEGQYWNDDLLKEYRTTLQETGLFSAIDMKPARLSPEQAKAAGWTERALAEAGFSELPLGGSSDTPPAASPANPPAGGSGKKAAGSGMPIWMTSDGTTPVSLTVRDAPPRTVSGGLQYSTDTGFGVRGAWENRNLFGGGEQLRVTAPISEDSQSLNASFRKPAFGIRDQALVGEAWAIN